MTEVSEDGLIQERKPATSPEPQEDGHEQGAGPAEGKHEDSEASSGDDPEETERSKGEVKRIKRAVRDRDVERGLRAEAERENERLKAELARVRAGGKPDEPDERKPAEPREDAPTARRDAAEWKSKVDDFQDDGEEKYDDFAEKVIDNPRVQITKTMAEVMMDTDNGVDVAYYLGQHPKESRRIAALSPTAQAREIGKLEVIVAGQAKAPVKPVSKTPRPIEPVSGGKVISGKLKPESSMEDFIKVTSSRTF